MKTLSTDWNDFLAEDPIEFRPLDSPFVHSAADSWSGARFWRWNAPAGPMLSKIWPPDGPDIISHRKRHFATEKLRDFRPNLALPLPDVRGRTLRVWPDGCVAEIFRWFEGVPASLLPEECMIQEVATVLARLHNRWCESYGASNSVSNAVVDRLAQLRRLAERGLVSLEKSLDDRIGADPQEIREAFREILNLSFALIPDAIRDMEALTTRKLPCQFILRDARPQHFLTIDGKVSAIVDFGAVGFDTVAVDLARLWSEWIPGDGARAASGFEAYESVRAIDSDVMAFVEPLMLSGAILGGLAWLDIHFRLRRSIGREKQLLQALKHARHRLVIQFERRYG